MTEALITKGDSIVLKTGAFTADKYYVGAGWDMVANGPDIDIDLFAVELDGSGKFTGQKVDMAFFGNKINASGSVQVGDDNRTGAGDGDDEFCLIDLSKVPASSKGIAVCINIYDGVGKRQSFGGVESAFVRLVRGDAADGEAVAGFKLQPSKLAPDATAVHYVSFLRNAAGEWEYKGVGKPLGDPKGGSHPQTAAAFITVE